MFRCYSARSPVRRADQVGLVGDVLTVQETDRLGRFLEGLIVLNDLSGQVKVARVLFRDSGHRRGCRAGMGSRRRSIESGSSLRPTRTSAHSASLTKWSPGCCTGYAAKDDGAQRP